MSTHMDHAALNFLEKRVADRCNDENQKANKTFGQCLNLLKKLARSKLFNFNAETVAELTAEDVELGEVSVERV